MIRREYFVSMLVSEKGERGYVQANVTFTIRSRFPPSARSIMRGALKTFARENKIDTDHSVSIVSICKTRTYFFRDKDEVTIRVI